MPAGRPVTGVRPGCAELAGQVAAVALAKLLGPVDPSVKMLCSLTCHSGLIDAPTIIGSRRWDRSPPKFTTS